MSSNFASLLSSVRERVPTWMHRFNRKYQTLAVLRMNDLLRQKNLTQRDVAKLTGWTPAYISRILSGSENLTLRTVARFEDAVDADVFEITGTPHKRPFAGDGDPVAWDDLGPMPAKAAERLTLQATIYRPSRPSTLASDGPHGLKTSACG